LLAVEKTRGRPEELIGSKILPSMPSKTLRISLICVALLLGLVSLIYGVWNWPALKAGPLITSFAMALLIGSQLYELRAKSN
jgi:hypothetical protein